MMYYLHIWSDHLSALNIFRYQTFRAFCAALTAFLICLLAGPTVIRMLTALKLGQPLRTKEEVHKLAELHGGKKGTPTMGGLLLIGSVLISSLLWARVDNSAVWLVLFSMTYLAGLGFWDDFVKVRKKNSAGVSERTKLVAQLFLAVLITVYFLFNPHIEVQARSLYVPFYKEPVIANLGWFTFLFFCAVIMGSSNAVNLTDGLDGLATGCTATAAFAYGVLAYVAGNVKLASYLQIPYYSFAGELTIICMALVGASLGFLWFNCHPARVFMGDTGSLAIGGTLGVVAICCKQELLLMVVGGVFVIEASSVLIQRTWFKITKARYGEGRRIFLMSPIHHHFELKGWKENTVIVRFWILSMMFAFLGLATLKLR
jgi:phospho-N-acetylmuramoyl-pentapeptide-transferase